MGGVVRGLPMRASASPPGRAGGRLRAREPGSEGGRGGKERQVLLGLSVCGSEQANPGRGERGLQGRHPF